MVQLLLGLSEPPAPFDAADALAIAVCHLHKTNARTVASATSQPARPIGRVSSWRAYRPR
jgi:hypothetical protein